MMKQIIWTLVMSAALLAGQDGGTLSGLAGPRLPDDAPLKVIPVRNARPDQVAESLRSVMGNQAIITSTDEAVIVRGSEAVIQVVEGAVNQLDVASVRPNIELTVQLLYGSDDADGEGPIPEDLQSTVEQLRGVFPYPKYRLLDSLLLRSSDSTQTEASGILPSPADTEQPVVYQFRFRPRVTEGQSPRRVLLQGLHFGARVPIVTGTSGDNKQFQYMDVGINTDLEVREGQKTVVGKSSIGADQAVILVVTLQAVE